MHAFQPLLYICYNDSIHLILKKVKKQIYRKYLHILSLTHLSVLVFASTVLYSYSKIVKVKGRV